MGKDLCVARYVWQKVNKSIQETVELYYDQPTGGRKPQDPGKSEIGEESDENKNLFR